MGGAGKLVCLILMFGLAFCEPSGKKESFDKNLDFILDFIDRGFVLENLTYINLSDYNGTIVQAHEIKLADISTLKRTGPSFMYTPMVDEMTVTANLGLKQLELDIEQLHYNNKIFSANLLAGTNTVDIQYTMHHKSKRICSTEWQLLKLNPMESVSISSVDQDLDNEDITELFNLRILPELNQHFASTEFLKKLNVELNFCLPF